MLTWAVPLPGCLASADILSHWNQRGTQNRDPIGEAGGINVYSMVDNDPLLKWDRFGLDAGGRVGPGYANDGYIHNPRFLATSSGCG